MQISYVTGDKNGRTTKLAGRAQWKSLHVIIPVGAATQQNRKLSFYWAGDMSRRALAAWAAKASCVSPIGAVTCVEQWGPRKRNAVAYPASKTNGLTRYISRISGGTTATLAIGSAERDEPTYYLWATVGDDKTRHMESGREVGINLSAATFLSKEGRILLQDLLNASGKGLSAQQISDLQKTVGAVLQIDAAAAPAQ